MRYFRFVNRIAYASAYLYEQRGYVDQRMGFVSVADDAGSSPLIEDVASFETGRGIEVDLLDGIGRLGDRIVRSQFGRILSERIPTGRTNDLYLFGSQSRRPNRFADKLHAVYEEVQIIRQVTDNGISA